MPAIEVWGPAVWTLFHTLAERVHEDAYPFIATKLFDQIVQICKVLPCPDCSTDASIFLKKINISTIKTKTDFKNLIYLFHNYVNSKKRKPLFNVINLDMYKYYKLIPVVNNFLNKFNTKGNMNLINESFQRSLVQNNFKKWISSNLRAFTQPMVVPQNTPVDNLGEEHIKSLGEEHIKSLGEEHIKSLEEEHIKSLEEVEEESVTVEETPVTVEEESVTVEETPVTVEEEPITLEEEPITLEEEPILEEVEEPILEYGEEPILEYKEELITVEEESVTSPAVEEYDISKNKKNKKNKKSI
jgi:hypothetical protein